MSKTFIFPHAGRAFTFLISQKSKQKTIVAAYNLLKIFSLADRKELLAVKQLFCLTATLKDFFNANSIAEGLIFKGVGINKTTANITAVGGFV